MFNISYNEKQKTAIKFYRDTELHLNDAVKKIAYITKGQGKWIMEYMEWEEGGTHSRPELQARLVHVKGFNFLENETEDAKFRLKNKGKVDPRYSDEQASFLINSTENTIVDRKTIQEYAEAGIGVEGMFITESTVNNATYYGNFDFKVHTIYGGTIKNSVGKRIGRFVLIADEEAKNMIDTHDTLLDSGLTIMKNLVANTIKATKDGD